MNKKEINEIKKTVAFYKFLRENVNESTYKFFMNEIKKDLIKQLKKEHKEHKI